MRRFVSVLAAAVALGAPAVASGAVFSGVTSQTEPISMKLAHHQISGLSFYAVVACPSGRHWLIHDYGFSVIPIVAGAFHFAAHAARQPHNRLRLDGQVRRGRVTGSFSQHLRRGGERCSASGVTFHATP